MTRLGSFNLDTFTIEPVCCSSMTSLELTNEESHLQREIQRLLEEYHQQSYGDPRIRGILEKMADLSHALHLSLKGRGVEPRHTKSMRENRGRHGIGPESRDFYLHVHPVEDLMKFVDNTEANRDPEDQTLGLEFRLTVYSRRWSHTDDYTLVRTATGWRLSCSMYGGECDKSGAPLLYKTLDHDSINYPEELGGYLGYLWEQAAEQGLSKEDVQTAFDALGEWVQHCEQHSPAGIFSSFK